MRITAYSILVLLLCLRVTHFAQTQKDVLSIHQPICPQSKGGKLKLENADKAEIVQQVLRIELKRERHPILLATNNIKAKWLTEFSPDQVVLLTRSLKFKKALGDGYYYCYFDTFLVSGDCVTVTFINDSSDGCNLCGTGSRYRFQKVAGKWVGQYVDGWMS